MKKTNKKTEIISRGRNLIWLLLGIIFILSLYLIIILGIWFTYRGRVIPGVTIAGVSVAGKSDAEIEVLFNEKTKSYLTDSKDLTGYEIKYDVISTISEAKSAVDNPFDIGQKRNIPLQFTYNKKVLLNNLQKIDKKYRTSVQNPVAVEQGNWLIAKPGRVGSRIIYGENTYIFLDTVGNLKNGFKITKTDIEPIYTVDKLQNELIDIGRIASGGLKLEYGSKIFDVTPSEIASWADIRAENRPLANIMTGSSFRLLHPGTNPNVQTFATDKIESFLVTIAKKIDRKPVDAALSMKDGKVSIFSLSRTGLALDIPISAESIILALGSGEQRVDLTVTETEPKVSKNSLSELGITELIAEGRSNFAGSPNNRRHNIRVGASKFNGVLIEPGETFSFTTTLGDVDASTGYLPELVIKANETIPEFGGGLCQVSSTAFRAALNAGLPIIARRPHAYPVTYYKPYGTDATIYIPNPDLKFNNDTGKYILIQTRISGNYLYFEFYGTKKNVVIKFAGNSKGTGAVSRVENIKPLIYDYGVRGRGSFTAKFWSFIYNKNGKLIQTEDYISKYDSPDKYPH